MNAMVPGLREGDWTETVTVWRRDDAPSTPDVTARNELDAESEMPNHISCSCSHRHAGDYMEIEDFGELLRPHKKKRSLSQDYENRVGLFSVETHEVDSHLVKASNSIGLDRVKSTRLALHSTCLRWHMLKQTGCCLRGRFTWIFIVTLKKDDQK